MSGLASASAQLVSLDHPAACGGRPQQEHR